VLFQSRRRDIVAILIGLALFLLSAVTHGWAAAARTAVILLVVGAVVRWLPRQLPIALGGLAFGLFYLAFGLGLLFLGARTIFRGDPTAAPLGYFTLGLGLLLTPTAALFLRKLIYGEDSQPPRLRRSKAPKP
jgi:hypothetical protein